MTQGTGSELAADNKAAVAGLNGSGTMVAGESQQRPVGRRESTNGKLGDISIKRKKGLHTHTHVRKYSSIR